MIDRELLKKAQESLDKEAVSPEWKLKMLRSFYKGNRKTITPQKQARLLEILRGMALKKQITPVGVGTTDKALLGRLRGDVPGLYTTGQAAAKKALGLDRAQGRLSRFSDFVKDKKVNSRQIPMDEYARNLSKGIMPE